MIARKLIYRGRVQGVGFRANTRDVASEFDVTGYVRNLDDGDVEVLVEGDATEVDRFLAALGDRMKRYIQSHDVDEVTPKGFESFDIRY